MGALHEGNYSILIISSLIILRMIYIWRQKLQRKLNTHFLPANFFIVPFTK